MGSPFAEILKTAVERTPRAIGGAFAASDGEMVDYFSSADPLEWALLTAHYGVLLGHLKSCLNMWHFGGPQYFVVEHSRVDVVVYPVSEGYYALMAIEQPAPLGQALTSMSEAVAELRKEMR